MNSSLKIVEYQLQFGNEVHKVESLLEKHYSLKLISVQMLMSIPYNCLWCCSLHSSLITHHSSLMHPFPSPDPLLTGSEQESGAVNSQWFMYSRTSQGCLWFRHTTIFTNVLMLLSGSLTIVGLVLCCTSSVNKNQRTGQVHQTI